MSVRWNAREHLLLARFILKWIVLASLAGLVIGSAVAFFLWALDTTTQTRWDHSWLLYLLPLAGVLVGLLYHALGQSVVTGNLLIIEQIHQPGGGVPKRMAPLVLIGTLITHLFGGSAGREGTAVQMGGSIASAFCRWIRLNEKDTSLLLMAGVAAGFGAVFGTPLTGALFAIEVISLRRMSFRTLIPCLIGSIVADRTCMAWHIHHTHYAVHFAGAFSWILAGKVAIASIAFGLASVLFIKLTHGIGWIAKRFIAWPPLRPAIGGLIVIGLVFAIGSTDYLGLGVSPDPHHPQAVTIQSAFQIGGATSWSWFWKTIFTAVTVGSGFKGGEVTPLFYIGATLGNALAPILNAPVDLLAGLGFIALFAGATNTPLACTVMGVELFVVGHNQPLGPAFTSYMAVACFISFLCSGRSSIYHSHRAVAPQSVAK